MKKITAFFTALALILGLCACEKKVEEPTWQEQYDLGVRCLSEGNYQEAILAFTAAIEIDPKRAPAYVGRGDAYVIAAQELSHGVTDPEQLGEDAADAYQNALEDYLKAIDLGKTGTKLYRKAAEVYIALGDPYTAAELLGETGSFLEHAIAVGDNSIALVQADGTLWGWGSVYGAMMTGFSTPTQIMTDAASVFGWNGWDGHSDVPQVYTAALTNDGTLWYLGSRPYPYEDYGDGTPIQVTDQAASAGAGDDALAVLKTDGSLWIYDWKDTGKVMEDVVSVSSCGTSVAAIKTDGSLWMWGDNSYGQLGIGSTERQDTPVKVMDSVRSVSVCHTHTAAVKTDGSLWMWGDNSYGQLGTGMEHNDTAFLAGHMYNSSTNEMEPAAAQFSVQTIPVMVMDHVALVSVNGGSGHSTHAVRTDGSLWCWGNNSSGQLGIGGSGTREVSVPHLHGDGGISYSTYTIQDIPVKVMDDVMAVSGNFGITAVIKRDGTVWMAGRSVTSWDENFEIFTEVPDLNYNPTDVK